jgi:glucose/arabinose dehydrogenase
MRFMEPNETYRLQSRARPFDKSTGKTRGAYEDFVTGFVTPDGKVWGRPVGVTVAKDGSLLVSEDGDKTIWRVSYSR